jgi:hypothetical protein
MSPQAFAFDPGRSGWPPWRASDHQADSKSGSSGYMTSRRGFDAFRTRLLARPVGVRAKAGEAHRH